MGAISSYGTYTDFVQVTAVDDGLPVDLSGVTEITIKLIDPYGGFDELMLTLGNGDIDLAVPEMGYFEWSVSVPQMRMIRPKLYNMIILIEESETDSTIQLVDAQVSITGMEASL